MNLRIRSAVIAVGALFLSLFVGVSTPTPAAAAACIIGSSASCPGASAQAIKDATGTNTDGVYWIYVNSVATQVYSIMNSAMDGGGWMLAMKGANTGNTFGYSANYWTTANTLNPSLTRRNDVNNEDAKFDVFNYTRASKVLAVFPDASTGGAIPSQSYGYTWEEDMPTPSNTTAYSGRPAQGDYTGKTLRELFNGGEKIFIRDAYATTPYRPAGVGVFSGQTDVRFFGYNYVSDANNNRARFGFGWNENGGGLYPVGNSGSNDVTGGIGLDSRAWSAGDGVSCCQNQTGVNRQMKFELYIKAFNTTPRQVQNLTAQPSDQQVAVTWNPPLDTGGFNIDTYTVEVSTNNETWTALADVPGSASGTVATGLTNSQRYYFRVTPVNLVGPGASATVSAIPSLPPTTPLNVRAVSSSFPNDCAVTLTSALTNTISKAADGDCVVTFTGVGSTSWLPPEGVSSVEVLVVAGGGGGGSDMGGGGGAGGLVYYGSESPRAGLRYPVSGATTITVGGGGNGAPAGTGQVRGTNGSNSVFGGITAIGGGGGASTHNNANSPAGAGGSGGGASGGGGGNGGALGAGTAGQGNAGSAAGGTWYPGGGGGAGGAGANNPGRGGVGLQYSITGTPTYFAGGGGGSGYSTDGGNGGAGGGGGGAVGVTTGGSGLNPGSPGGGGSQNSQTNYPGGNAGANTGGGGGGGSHFTTNNKGGNGGSGVVVLKYASVPSAGAAVYFDLPASDGGQPITQYIVTASDGHSGTGTHSPVYVPGLVAGQGYTFTMVAVNPAGTSPISNRTNQVWPVVRSIGAPKNVVAISGSQQVTLSWSPPDTSTVTVGDYLVQYKTSTGEWQEWLRSASTDTSTVITGLTDGLTYIFKVASWGEVDTDTAISTWVTSNAVIPATPFAGSFGTPVPTADGFTVPINNLDTRLTWDGTVTNGGTLSVKGPIGAWPADLTPYSRYKASDYNAPSRTWYDSSGNDRNILPNAVRGSPTVESTTAGTNGTTKVFTTVKGTTADGIKLGNPQLNNWTLFHVARYQGTNNGRIFTSESADLFSGFYGGNSGISYHNGWITGNTNLHSNNWVASTDYFNGYRSNGFMRGSTTGGITYLPPMTINYGASTEYSDFQVAEVITFDRLLTTAEMARVEDYLATVYGISGYTTVSSSSSDTPTVIVSGIPAGVTSTGTLNVGSAVPGILNNTFTFTSSATASIASAPRFITASTSGSNARIMWKAPTKPGGVITSYTATAQGQGNSCTWTSGPLECTITGLGNQLDTVTVTATNATGTSVASPYVVVGTYVPTFGTPVPTPQGFTVPISNYITTWQGFPITWASSVNASGTSVISAGGLLTITRVMGGESSTAVVTATHASPGTRVSSSSIAATASTAIPTVPQSVAVTSAANQATVTWATPDIPGGPITSYTVTSGRTGNICTWTTGTLRCTVTGLIEQIDTFTVVATNAQGTSVASAPVTAGTYIATYGTPVPSPEGFSVPITNYTVIDNAVDLTWSSSATNSGVTRIDNAQTIATWPLESSTATTFGSVQTKATEWGWTVTDRTTTGAFTSNGTAISDDGTRIAAIDYNNGGVKISSDSGATWSFALAAGSGYWADVAMSGSGQRILVVGQSRSSGPTAKMSNDFGATWSTLTTSCSVWQGAAMSTDGTHIVIGCGNGGTVAISSDAGSTWSYFNPPVNWASWVAMSSDGTKIAVATGQSGGNRAGPIYTSTDSGATFTTQYGSGNHYWNNIAISDDGTRLAASSYDAGLYTSSDSGVTWTQRTGTPTGATAMSASADGSVIVMSQNGSYIYTSTNYGVTFTQQTSYGAKAWATYGGVTLTRDGTKFVATANESGHIYTATANAAVYVTGKVGTALQFNGTSYIAATSPITRSFSSSFWIKTTQTGCGTGQWYQGCGIIDARTSGNDFGVALLGNSIGFGLGSGDVTAVSYKAINDGTWHHVAVTWDAITGAMKVFIDGNLDGSATGPTAARNTATTIYIGKGANYTGLNGALDEIRLYNGVLTQAQVTASMGETPAALVPTLVVTRVMGGESSTASVSITNGSVGGYHTGVAPITVTASTDTPTVPLLLTASAPDTSTITIGWSQPDVPGGRITSYTVTSSPDNRTCTWTTGTKSCTFTGLSDRYYTFSVTATNAVGTSVAATIGAGKYEPIFGAASPTVVGYSVPLLNYDPRLSYTGSATNGGTVAITGTSTFPAGITPYMRFEANNYDPTAKIWYDTSGSGRNVPAGNIGGSPTLVTATANTNGSQKTFPVVQGTTSTYIRFGNPSFSTGNWTFFTMARYTGGSRGRIFDAEGQNWLDGFYSGTSGVAHHNSWIASGNRHGDNWVLSASYRNTYRSNGVTRGTSGGDANFYPMAVNYVREQSDYQIAEVLIFNRELSPNEVSQVEDYLAKRYGLIDYPMATAGAALETATVTVTGLIGGTTSTTTISATSGVASVRNGSGTFTATASRSRPTVPRNIAVVPQDGGMTISWDSPAVWGGIITDYTVTGQRTGSTCHWTNGPLNCVILGLTNGVAETFTVTATNITGTSDTSTSVSGIPQKRPGIPTINSLTGVQGVTRPDMYTDGLVQWISPSAYTGSGTQIVDSKGGSNVTLGNSPTFSAAEPAYFTLNGSNQYILNNTGLSSQLAMSGGTRSNTISTFLWVYPTAANGVILAELGQSSINAGWHDSHIEIVGGTMKFRVWNGAVITSTIATPLNNWYYVGYVYDQATSTLTAYINGQVAVTSSGYSRQSPYNNGGADQYYAVGSTEGTSMGAGNYMAMRFGGLYVYKNALTLAQIQQNMEATSGGFTTPLTTPSVEIAFTPPSDNGGGTITSYVATSSGGQTASSATSPVTVKGLTNGVEYTFTLRAVNAAGPGAAASTTTPFVPKAAPSVPAAPTGTLGDGKIFLVWSAPDANGDPITDYDIQFSTNSGTSWTTYADGVSASTSAEVSGLTNGTNYLFRIRVKNAQGASAYSQASSPYSPASLPSVPNAPVGIASGTSVYLTWSAPASNGAAITDYLVQSSANNGSTWSTFADGTSAATGATVTGLSAGSGYIFRVAAVNGVGSSAYSSSSLSTSLGTPPNPPIDVVGTASSGQVALSWSTPTPTFGGLKDSTGTCATTVSNSAGVSLTLEGSECVLKFTNSASTTWTVPGGVGAVILRVDGASAGYGGNDGRGYGSGGPAGRVSGILPIAPGSQVVVAVGTAGANGVGCVAGWGGGTGGTNALGYNGGKGGNAANYGCSGGGGGGGGASVIRIASNNIVAGGAGAGAGGNNCFNPTAAQNGQISGDTLTANAGGDGGFTPAADGGGAGGGGGGANGGAGGIMYNPCGEVQGLGGVMGTNSDGGNTSLTVETYTPDTNANGVIIIKYASTAVGSAAPIDDYLIQYSTNSGSSWSTFTDGVSSATNATVNGLLNGTSYIFRVASRNGQGTSVYSPATSAYTPRGGPTSPTISSITAGNGLVMINLTAPISDGGNPITRYTVTSSPGGATCIWTSGPQNCSIAGLTNGTTYTFTATATTAIGTSPASAAATSKPRTLAGTPTNVTVSTAPAQATITWNAPSANGGDSITAYTAMASPGGQNCVWSSGPLTCTITGLTNGVSYIFTVVATNSAGSSPASTPSNPAMPVAAPGAPTALTATVGSASAFLTWGASASNGLTLTDYEVQFSTDSGTSWTTFADGTGVTTAATVTGLTNGNTYNFRVRGVNLLGGGTWSAPSSGATPATIPGTPTSVSYSATNAQATVTFTAPANGGAAISRYQYSINGGASWINLSGTTSPLTIAGLTNGVTYSVMLRAVNSQGGGAPTAAANVTPISAPDAPVILSTVAENQKITVAYTAPNDNGGAAITAYTYRVNSGSWTATPSSPIVLSSLTNGSTYVIEIRATNSAGSGTAASVTSVPFTTPGTPTITGVTPSSASLSVAFTAGSNGGSALLGYEYSIDGGTNWVRTSSTASPLTIAGLVNGTSYTVKLHAINLAGIGGNATSSAATPRTVPGTPQITSVTPGSGTITLAFTASDGGSSITFFKYRTRSSVQTGVASCAASYDTLTWNAWPGTWTSVATPVSTVTISVAGTNCYDTQVKATNAAGDSAESRASGKPLTLPSAPAITSVIPGNARAIVNFTEPTDNGGSALTKYQYQVNSGTWVDLTTGGDFTLGTSTRFVITGLTNGSAASVVLRAVNTTGASASSSAVSATPATVPDMPAASNLVPLDGGFRVEFTPAGNGGSAITAYEYQITPTSTNIAGAWIRATWASGTVFTIAGLTNGDSYYVDIRAVNAIGASAKLEGPSSSPGSAPAAPSIASVITSDSKISIVVAAGNNGGYPITEFSYSLNGGTTWTTPTPNPVANPIVVTGLTNGTTYQVRVRTHNTMGDSDPSAVTATTPSTAPAAPSITAITPTDSTLSVAFTAPSNTGGATITTYEYSIDGGTLWSTRASGTIASPLVITGLRNGAAYAIKIRAVNAIASGTASSATTAIPQVPGAGKPTNVAVSPLNGAVLVSWRAPEGWVGDPITSYRVNATPGSASCTWTTGASSCEVSGLTNGVTYSFTVTSVGAGGDIDFANAASTVTPRSSATAPVDVSALAGGGEASVSWNAPTDTGGSAITDYLIQFSSDAGTTWTTFVDGTSTDASTTVTGLNPATAYVFRVAAVNPSGTSPYSTATTAITTFALGPDLALVPVSRTGDGFTFQLSLVGSGSVADYSISTTGGTVVRDGLNFTVRGMSPGATSTIALTAARSGYSTSRATITGTALLAGTAPSLSAVTNTENGFTFTIASYGASGTSYTYLVNGPGSVVDDGSGTIRVVGLAPGESAIVTVRANRYGYVTTSANATGAVLRPGVPPTLSTAIGGRRSYSFVILDWVSTATYTLTATNSAVAVLETSTVGTEVTAKVTVSNLGYVASARTTVLIQRTGYADASLDIVGTSNGASSDATLSALALTTGAVDGFTPATPNYTVNVPYATTSIQVRPTKNETDAVIRYKVGTNSLAELSSGALSPSLALSVGSNTITIQVTAASGAVNTYLVRVVRAPSSNALLAGMTTTAGSIGAFNTEVLTYVANVTYDSATVTVTPTLSDSNATMQVRINGGTYSAVTNATASSALALQVGNNTIQIVVTAQDGNTTQTYTLTVARGGPTKAQLTALAVSPGAIGTFNSATLNYEVNLPAGTSSITITPTVSSGAFVRVNGADATTGVATAPIALSPGTTTIAILVTSSDLTVTTPYQVRITLDSIPARTSLTRRSVGAVSGVVFTTQPQVAIVDSAAQTVLLGAYNITARIASGDGGSLIGTTTASTTRGVAVFSGLGIRGLAGTSYVIAYEVDGLIADTQTVTVTAGAPTKLAFVQNASGAQNAVAFTGQPRVSIQDALGNVVTTASDPITVAITAGVGGTLFGSTSQVAASGLSTFAGLGMRGVAGRTYTLTYSSGSLTSVTETITVTPGVAQGLSITRASAGLVSGDPFATQPQVSIVDSGGNIVTSATGIIQIALTGTNGATLAGTVTASLVSGTATFNDLALTGPGNINYTLTYTTSGFAATTESVRLASGAAHHIALTRSAAGFYNGSAFATQPQVTIYDRTNNVIPTFTGNMVATVSSGGSLVGSTTVAAVAGVANFSNLGITGTAGTTYVVTFTTGAITPVTQSLAVEAGAGLTPTTGIVTSTPDGFTFQITNFTNLFRWDLRISAGTVNANLGLSPTGLVTVTGVPTGANATVTLATSRSGYQPGTASVLGSALQPAIRAAFGTLIQTATGFKAQILNYDSSYNWSVSASNGATATVSSAGMVTVTGLAAGATSVATVSSSRASYATISSQVSGASAGTGGTIPTDVSANLATGKTIAPVCGGANSTLEGVANLNDLRSSTKYLCFLTADRSNTSYTRNSAGFVVTGMTNSIVTGIQFTSGDADISRDPMVFSLYGCNADGSVCKTLVTNGRTGLGETRNTAGSTQSFRNTAGYASIMVLFGSLRNTWTDAMQLAEITLTGAASQASALVPAFGALTSTASGYDVTITNFDDRLNWTGTAPTGVGVSVSSTGIARITGIRPGETATVSISSAGVDRATGTASITGGSLLGALMPVLGSATSTSDGFTATITNYTSTYVWSAAVDTGTASITPVTSTTATLRVAGQASGGSVFTRVTTTRSGYADGIAYIRSTTNNPGLMPLFGASVQTLNGFRVQLTNYDSVYNWAVSTTAGIATISATGLVTVAGMSAGATAIVSVTSSREGYFDVVGTTKGFAAVGAAVTPQFGFTKSTSTGFTVQITNFDTGFAWTGVGTNGETVTIGATGLVTVTGVATQSNSNVTISVSKSGYVTGSAQVSATAVPEQAQSLSGSDITILIPISATASVSDVTVKIDIPVDAAPASTVFNTGAVGTESVDAGLRTVTIDASNGGSSVTTLNEPIAITLPASSVTGVPVYSPDGVTFIEIPQLTSLLLPDGQSMGYYRYSDGSIVIISRIL